MGRRAKPWHRKQTDAWYVWHGGEQVPLGVKGAGNRAEAEKAFHRLKAAEGTAERQRAASPVGGLVDVYLDDVERNCLASSVEARRPYLLSFARHVGAETPAGEIRPHHVTAWADRPTWGHNTRSRALGWIKQFFAWAEEQGYLETNPVARLKRSAMRRRAKVMTAAQADGIAAAVDCPAFGGLLAALRGTGCRPGEVYSLTADRIDLEAGTWRVVDKIRGKTGEECRTVYLSPAMIELSRRLLEGRPEGLVFRNTKGRAWTDQAVAWRFQEIRRKLGGAEKGWGEECIAYSYRHLYITDALERGVPPATVAELVGHRSLNMIMRVYSRLAERTGHLREAARQASRG